jgi:hypothetical protein
MAMQPRKLLRWVYEVSFSLNVAWIVVWHYSRTTEVFWLLSPWVNKFYWRFHTLEPEVVVAQVLWSAVLCFIGFVGLRLLSWFSATEVFLRTIAGSLSVLGLPVAALILGGFSNPAGEILVGDYYQWFYPTEAYRLALWVEVLVVFACVVLYYLKPGRVSGWLGSVLLLLHFSLWSWASGSHVSLPGLARAYGSLRIAFWISSAYYWGLPVIGFVSSLCWLWYIRPPSVNRQRSPTFDKTRHSD